MNRSFVIPVLDMSPASPYNIEKLLVDLENIPGELIVIFNSIDIAEKFKNNPRIDHYAIMKVNVGVSRAWNIGLNISQTPVTFIMNADLHISSTVINKMEQYLIELEDAAIVGPQGSFYNFEEAKDIVYFEKGSIAAPIVVDAVSGFLFAVKTELFNSGVLKFDNQYSPCYFEEWDLGLQIKQQNLKSYIVPVDGYNHEWSGSIRSLRTIKYLNKEETAGEILERNRKLFWNKWKGISNLVGSHSNLLISYWRDILYFKAKNHINKNENVKAEKLLNEILQQYPLDKIILMELKELALKCNKLEKALEVTEKLQVLNPDSELSLKNVGNFNEDWYSDGQLDALVTAYGYCKDLEGDVIEIGCWEGKSTVALANKCYPQKIIAVDHWLGNLGEGESHVSIQILKNRDVFYIFQQNINKLTHGNVEIKKMDCFDFLSTYKEKIKFCHIDASHNYHDVKKTIEMLLPKLVNGGVLCGDDYLTSNISRKDLDGGVERAVKEVLPGFKNIENFWYYIKDTKHNLQHLMISGLQYYKEKNYLAAIENFSKYLSTHHENYEIYNLLGISHNKLENLKEAKESFEKCLKLNQNFTDAYFNLGIIYIKQGEYKIAASYFLKCLLPDPNSVEVNNIILRCYEEYKKKYKDEFVKHKLTNAIATVIRFSSMDDPFIDICINNITEISQKVILIACDKLWDGTNDLPGINKIIERNKKKNVEFHIVSLEEKNTTSLTYHSEWIVLGWEILRKSAPYILFIDGDEIADANLITKWKKSFETDVYSMRFTNYYYFREPIYRSIQLENSPLIVSTDLLQFLIESDYNTLFYQPWDRNFFNYAPVIYNEYIVFHHYSWVRTKEQMLKKVKTWHHKNERNWVKLVEDEFSHDFNGKDFVHGYQYITVPNEYNIRI